MGSGKAVSVESVTKRFGDHIAVRDLSLEVAEGAVYGLLGPNGAGKTTTIRMVLNIIAPDSGSVKLFGQRLRGRPGTMAGYLPEERGLYPRMRVLSHLVFFGVIKGMPRREARAKAEGRRQKIAVLDHHAPGARRQRHWRGSAQGPRGARPVDRRRGRGAENSPQQPRRPRGRSLG